MASGLRVLARVAVVDEQVVAHADAEERAAREVGLERGEALTHLRGAVHPEVEDAGRGHERGRGVEEVAERAEHVAPDVGDPRRGVPQLLELGDRVALLAFVAVAQLAAPDADPTQVHACILLQVA